MRILVYSNAPWSWSGYGTQTAQLVPRLADAGHDVAVAAFHGLQAAPLNWQGFMVYPGSPEDPWAQDVLQGHYAHHQADLLITLMDAWVLNPALLAGMNTAHWMPVDCSPLSAMDKRVLAEGGGRPVAMSEFGRRQLEDAGWAPLYVPHAISTQAFAPLPGRDALRAGLGLADRFLIGINAANQDPVRKGLAEQFEAFAAFRAAHPQAQLLVNARCETRQGVSLNALAAACGLGPDCLQFADQYLYSAGLFGQDKLARWYGLLDVLSNCSYGEGFGLPVLEAQACFPAETPISAGDVVTGMERRFTGELVRIEAADGNVVEATPEHPFWTTRGWVQAQSLTCDDRLLYLGMHASKGNLRTYTGRASDIVGSVRSDAAARSGQAHGQDLRLLPVARPATGPAQNLRPVLGGPRGYSDTRAVELCGRSHRRRRNGLHPAVHQEVEANGPDRQHVLATHGVAVDGRTWAVCLHRTPETPRYGSSVLHVPFQRLGTSQSLRGATATTNNQARSDGVRGGVHPRTPDAGPAHVADGAPAGTDCYSAEPEYRAIRSLSRRAVRDLPVYNLTTLSGTYTAAGFLVHNCGTPVVVTDFSAMSELCGSGWLAEGARYWNKGHSAWWVRPSVAAITEAYEEAFALWQGGGLGAYRDKAREFSLAYDADRVLAEHWVPALSELAA